ncbi:MAG: beta-lactamase family protein [Cyclobacteriaceae bacterium]|nr:beta-lactamase family protein [Cyclobacteriaceae bacterium]
MKSLVPFLLLFLLVGCSSNKEDARGNLFDEYLSGQAKHFKFNGNVLIAERGNILYQKSFGLADFDSNRPLNDSSVFELASVSKQFTAMGILLLEQNGMLSLQDSLRKFFPELPYSGITVHHMLTHISGLPDYMDIMEEKWDRARIAGNADIVTLLAQEKPEAHFKPGTKWEYSNTAFALLASIIEKVSGQSFKTYMQDNIFKPLGMTRTRVYNTRRSGERIENYAFGYVWSDSLNKHVLPDSVPRLDFVRYLDGIQGDGIINSTTSDLLKWDRALANHDGLPSAAIEKLLSRHSLVDTASNVYYGYGVMLEGSKYGEQVAHGGGWPGYATYLTRYADRDVTIIVLSNNSAASPRISNAIAAIVHGDSVIMPYEHAPVRLTRNELSRFEGQYKFDGESFELKVENDSLFLFSGGRRRLHLIPESESKVFADNKTDTQFELQAGREGSQKLFLIFSGVKKEVQDN